MASAWDDWQEVRLLRVGCRLLGQTLPYERKTHGVAVVAAQTDESAAIGVQARSRRVFTDENVQARSEECG